MAFTGPTKTVHIVHSQRLQLNKVNTSKINIMSVPIKSQSESLNPPFQNNLDWAIDEKKQGINNRTNPVEWWREHYDLAFRGL